jgi:broad specificity phosphatase PhoE
MRHGETTLNEKGRVSGAAPDVNLTERGKQQTRALAAHLKPPYALAFSSKLKRSRLTLAIALAEAGIRAQRYADSRLGERSLGELEGRRNRHIEGFFSGDLLFAPPGGEPYLSVVQRCLSFLVDVHTATRKKAGARVLVCTHMGPMRVLKAILTEEKSARSMMHYSFKNSELIQIDAGELQWPPFLEDAWKQPEDGTETSSTSTYQTMWESIRRLRRV